jgi:hypothetical protein
MPRLLYSLFFVVFAWIAGCGLSDRERAVATANEAIRSVEEAGESVADKINGLPEQPLEPGHFGELTTSLSSYMSRVDTLKAAMRTLVDFVPALQGYHTDTFLPAVSAAESACQDALDAMSSAASDQSAYQRALTRVGLCLERVATAVTNFAGEYGTLDN